MGLHENLRQAHLDEPCPKCDAKPGDHCTTPKGKKTAKPHVARIHNGTALYMERMADGYYTPRGIHNNNPGNLRPGRGYTWQGEIGIDDRDFLIFDTAHNGIRALARTLHTYIARDGCGTLNLIAHRWAPAGDGNNPDVYAHALAERTGFDINDSLVPTEPVIRAITIGIVWNENGEDPYSGDQITDAVRDALMTTKSTISVTSPTVTPGTGDADVPCGACDFNIIRVETDYKNTVEIDMECVHCGHSGIAEVTITEPSGV